MSDSRSFPRALPFQPPPAPKAPSEVELRRWALRLALGTVSAVALLVVLGVTVLIVALRPGSPAEQTEPRVEAGQPTPPAPAARPMLPTTAATPTAKALSLPESPPKPRTPPLDLTLDLVGSLTATHLRQTHLNIGLLVDATENEVYTTAQAQDMLATILKMLDAVDARLAKFADAGLEPAEQKRLAKTRALLALLRTQALTLDMYWDTPDTAPDARKEHAAKYQKVREQTAEGIRDLLGIKD